MSAMTDTVSHSFASIDNEELQFLWQQAGRNLSGARLVELADGAPPEGQVEEVFVRVREAMLSRQLPL